MVIIRAEREIPSVLAACYCLTEFSDCKTKKKLNQDLSLKLELSPGHGLRQWPALDKNVRHRYDVSLRTLWRENKFLSTRIWQFWRHFGQILLIFFILTSHLQFLGIYVCQIRTESLSLCLDNHHHTYSWDVVTMSLYEVAETYHWGVLKMFHWDLVGCFIWDVTAALLWHTERCRQDIPLPGRT